MGGTGTVTRLAAAGVLALAGFGCAAPYIAERYAVGVSPVQVVLDCRDVYEAFERRDAERILITSSAGTEATVGICGIGRTRAERYRAAAERYFLQTDRAAKCRIVGETELSPLHTEFDYRCGKAVSSALAVK